jgi:flagellar biogenesis protein FliO
MLKRLKNPYVIKGFQTLTREEYTSAKLTGTMGFVIGCILLGIFIIIKLFINYYKRMAY